MSDFWITLLVASLYMKYIEPILEQRARERRDEQEHRYGVLCDIHLEAKRREKERLRAKLARFERRRPATPSACQGEGQRKSGKRLVIRRVRKAGDSPPAPILAGNTTTGGNGSVVVGAGTVLHSNTTLSVGHQHTRGKGRLAEALHALSDLAASRTDLVRSVDSLNERTAKMAADIETIKTLLLKLLSK